MKLDSLLEKPKTIILLALFIAGISLYFIFQLLIFAPIMAQYPIGYGFMELKYAWTKIRIDQIISVWMVQPQNLIGLMLIMHVFDFFFMIIYATALSTATLLIARKLGETGSARLDMPSPKRTARNPESGKVPGSKMRRHLTRPNAP